MRIHNEGPAPTVPFGHDNANDADLPFDQTSLSIRSDSELKTTIDSQDAAASTPHFQISIPTFTNGITPYGYQQALRNRIKDPNLARGGKLDIKAYTPTFVHDCLMLPGSLGNVIGKGSPMDILPRMTPAILPGFHAHVHSETHQPCILPSSRAGDYVQGMLIFGQGKKARGLIHSHYRPLAKRVKTEVEVDVAVPVLHSERQFSHERWRLKRRKIGAHVWVWSDRGSGQTYFDPARPAWTIENYLSGYHLGPHRTGVVDSGNIGADYEIDLTNDDDKDETCVNCLLSC